MSFVWLQFHDDASARQAAGDEGAGHPSLRHGQHEFLRHRAYSRRQRCRGFELGARRSSSTSRALDQCRRGGGHPRRDVALCKKKSCKLWVWRAYDPITRRTIAWVLGGRDDATCQKLLNKIGLEGKTFVTDDWEGYHRLIPDDQLFTGKDLTVPANRTTATSATFSHGSAAARRSSPRSSKWSICR